MILCLQSTNLYLKLTNLHRKLTNLYCRANADFSFRRRCSCSGRSTRSGTSNSLKVDEFIPHVQHVNFRIVVELTLFSHVGGSVKHRDFLLNPCLSGSAGGGAAVPVDRLAGEQEWVHRTLRDPPLRPGSEPHPFPQGSLSTRTPVYTRSPKVCETNTSMYDTTHNV